MPRRKEERMKAPATMIELYNSVPIDTQGVSEFISRHDAESKKRLERMNERLRDLEKQMRAMEAEVKKASFSMEQLGH